MGAGRRRGLVGALMLLAACAGGTQSTVTRPTQLRPAAPPGPVATTVPPAPAVTPWGNSPVPAPPELVATARAYYDEAGPSPDDLAPGHPACVLLLPTGLDPAVVQPVPTSSFNVFGEFGVHWTLASGNVPALTLSVMAPGDPTDTPFFAPDAQVTTFADGSELRVSPAQPRSSLLRIPTQNCEYEVSFAPDLPPEDDGAILFSLRLVYAP